MRQSLRINQYIFQSTLSMRRATDRDGFLHTVEVFQSTLSMRRATSTRLAWSPCSSISIHALHEESDVFICTVGGISLIISIHALHEESDVSWSQMPRASRRFQSTLSMRRATRKIGVEGAFG